MKPHSMLQSALAVVMTWLSIGNAGATAKPVPQLFIASDSTASEYKPNPKNQQGWGAVLQSYFDADKLIVVDLARGGRSSRTFVTEGHWDRLIEQVHPGDFVIIQFGHNDAGAVNAEPEGSTRPLRARGSIPGIGDESQEIDNVLTGKHETVYSYGWYLRKMISETRAKQATPILITLTKTNSWNEGRVPCKADSYRLWTWQSSQREKVAFVDLTRIAGDRYQRMGPEAVKGLFIDDATHSNLPGAEANARDVVSGLLTLKGMPFRKALTKEGRKIAADPGPPKDSVCETLSSAAR
jgi:lysophospholipase L1-like esterase